MTICELCDRAAGMYCESDQASLCWECDAKVHGANFLVARHARVLLCQSCHEHTPWRASGTHLRPTVSFCESCADIDKASLAGEEEWEEDKMLDEEEDAEDSEDGDDSYASDDEDEDGDNQVVPWTHTPPPPASSSSGDESSSPDSASGGFLRRFKD